MKLTFFTVSFMVLAAIAIGISIPVSNNNKSEPPPTSLQQAKNILDEEPIFDG